MQNGQHIRSAFDKALEGIQANMLKMGGLVEANIISAAKALEERDVELAEKVRERDRQIDNLEELINDGISRSLIAQESPVATDLRVLLSILKVSNNLERIGDHAKNTAKRTHVLLHLKDIENSQLRCEDSPKMSN